jgi:threonylcarbamoyladenosine tRNA methylthiotransferase MtaB
MSKTIAKGTLSERKKALVRVLGCKVNQAEAEAIAQMLESLGYYIDDSTDAPDIIVVNTCCVTSKAEGKSRRMVNRLAGKFPAARMIVTGCLAEINPSSLQQVAPAAILLGTFEKERFSDFIAHAPADVNSPGDCEVSAGGAPVSLGTSRIRGRSRAFLKVQDGCSQSCSYCIVPSARGPSRSLPADEILLNARNLDASGYAEIVLTGIHLGSYGRDLDFPIGLDDLLERLLAECPSTRFRLSSVEPQEITHRLIELAARHPGVCRHFHIPLQSGDDNILSRMGRPYNSAFIRDLMDRILSSTPETCIGLDVMVGFPGEDEEAFSNTLTLVRDSGAAYLHVFPFSPRPGTPAASFKSRVPEKIARQRVEELRALSRAMRRRFYERFIGTTFFAVLESEPDPKTGLVVARTDNYIPVQVEPAPDNLRKHAFPVTLQRILDEKVLGSYGRAGIE